MTESAVLQALLDASVRGLVDRRDCGRSPWSRCGSNKRACDMRPGWLSCSPCSRCQSRRSGCLRCRRRSPRRSSRRRLGSVPFGTETRASHQLENDTRGPFAADVVTSRPARSRRPDSRARLSLRRRLSRCDRSCFSPGRSVRSHALRLLAGWRFAARLAAQSQPIDGGFSESRSSPHLLPSASSTPASSCQSTWLPGRPTSCGPFAFTRQNTFAGATA